ncbi:DUF4167 domain-containing protein [Pelagibacteraceae bacterium]|nr:DUF4167 domain-containing protein [Pelagibacteraceae bacterium]
MNDTKRRPFRPRSSRTGYRPRNNSGQNSNGHFKSNGNGNMGRNNGSMTNPFNVEKTANKYQQLAKDAHTAGDPVLYENYLQHAEHFIRRLAELNVKPKEQVTESSNLSKPPVDAVVEKKEIV